MFVSSQNNAQTLFNVRPHFMQTWLDTQLFAIHFFGNGSQRTQRSFLDLRAWGHGGSNDLLLLAPWEEIIKGRVIRICSGCHKEAPRGEGKGRGALRYAPFFLSLFHQRISHFLRRKRDRRNLRIVSSPLSLFREPAVASKANSHLKSVFPHKLVRVYKYYYSPAPDKAWHCLRHERPPSPFLSFLSFVFSNFLCDRALFSLHWKSPLLSRGSLGSGAWPEPIRTFSIEKWELLPELPTRARYYGFFG